MFAYRWHTTDECLPLSGDFDASPKSKRVMFIRCPGFACSIQGHLMVPKPLFPDFTLAMVPFGSVTI